MICVSIPTGILVWHWQPVRPSFDAASRGTFPTFQFAPKSRLIFFVREEINFQIN